MVSDGEWYSDIKHDNHLGVVRIWGVFEEGRVEEVVKCESNAGERGMHLRCKQSEVDIEPRLE